jgi:DNA-binding transcriptional regulator/RsmH inhibitor MraZ
VSVDNAGRMLIPQPLRRMLNLERELYLFTAGSWFEVWDRPRWEDQALPEAAALWDQLYGFDSLKPPAGPVPA